MFSVLSTSVVVAPEAVLTTWLMGKGSSQCLLVCFIWEKTRDFANQHKYGIAAIRLPFSLCTVCTAIYTTRLLHVLSSSRVFAHSSPNINKGAMKLLALLLLFLYSLEWTEGAVSSPIVIGKPRKAYKILSKEQLYNLV